MIKKLFTSLLVAALCSLPVVSAQSAESVRVSLKKGLSAGDMEVTRVMPPGTTGAFYNAKDVKTLKGEHSYAWHVVRIPLQVAARAGSDKPTFVDELEVKVHVVMMGGKGADKPLLLTKDITYVDIPLDPAANDDGTVVNVGVFLSPADAMRICGPDVKVPELAKRLGAVAVTAKFKGSACNNTSANPGLVVARDLKDKLTGSWWKKEDAENAGVALKSIAETPFAPYYSPVFPATRPMYGEPFSPAAAGISALGTTTIPGGSSAGVDTSSTSVDSTTETSADTSTETTEDTSSTGGKKKKGKKNKRNR